MRERVTSGAVDQRVAASSRFDDPSRAAAEIRELPRVSVIVPVRNEERYIEHCLAQLLSQDYPGSRLEILVVDSMSEDGTRAIVHRLQKSTGAKEGAGPDGSVPPVIRLLEDPNRQRASALNKGILSARGEVIARVDARSMVPRDYVARCVATLSKTGADNVGGVQQPIARSPMQEAIGMAMSHPFGIGNAQFRLGRRSGFVDTVYLGSYRRAVFDKVGLFDDAAPVLSEDSDINQRFRDSGGRVYLNTEIRAGYFPRETLGSLGRLYFRYGGARAGNFLKHRKLTSWRQAVPPIFLIGLVAIAALALTGRIPRAVLFALLGGYLVCDLGVSAHLAWLRRKWYLWPRLVAVFPCMHFAWALGFFRRLVAWPRQGDYWP